MVQSLNSQADFHTKANVLQGFSQKHGRILIGDKAVEFYNDRNPKDYIQIPWQEILQVRAQMYLNDRYIRGFSIDTRQGLTVNLVVQEAGKALKMMRPYLNENKIVRHQPKLSFKSIRSWIEKKIR